jgi:hypothetical protein
MNIIGRNDPCPCGSGKKYKRCHGAVAEDTIVDGYDRIRQLDGEVGEKMITYIARQYGKEGMQRALDEYGSDDEAMLDPMTAQGDSFIRWLTFSWRPEGNRTAAENFITTRRWTISADAVRLIESTLASSYSYYQVLSVDPDIGATMHDIFRKHDVFVRERSATSSMRPGLIMYARVVAMDGLHFFMGTGPCVITPQYLNRLVTLRSALESTAHATEGVITTETLLANEDLLREEYFAIEDEVMHPMRTLVNRDNEPYLMHTLTYSISSVDDAFQAMKGLQQDYTGESDEELLDGAVRNEDGTLAEIALDWIKDAPNSQGVGENIVAASIKIKGTTMTIEVNSEARAKRIQEEVRTRLGGTAVLQKIETLTAEELADRPKRPESEDERAAREDEERILRESPEVQAKIKAMMEEHWKRWPDTSIPALRGMTPRQAAKDPIGRELLDSLLLDIETRNSTQDDALLRIDVTRLRRELGLS